MNGPSEEGPGGRLGRREFLMASAASGLAVVGPINFGAIARVKHQPLAAGGRFAYGVASGFPSTTQITLWYHYRFATRHGHSRVGRFRTLPPADSRQPVRIGFYSCSSYEAGYYTALAGLANEPDLDLVLCLGDYIYEHHSYDGPAARQDRTGANHDGDVQTLAEYRQKYRLYQSDPHLQAMHAGNLTTTGEATGTPVGTELLGGSATSFGLPEETGISPATLDALRGAEDPHIVFADFVRHGYCVVTVAEKELRGQFKTADTTRPTAPASVLATFVVSSGTPELRQL